MARLTAIKSKLLSPQGRKLGTASASSWRDGKTTNERGYTYAWQQTRKRFLRANPLCAYCEARGRVTPALVVDHKVPHQGDRALFWDEGNWQPLCKDCHDSVKQREEREARQVSGR